MAGAAERVIRIELVGLAKLPHLPYLKLNDVHEVIYGRLGLKPTDLDGVQRSGDPPKRYDFIVKSCTVWYNKDLDRFMDQKLTLASGKVVELCRAFEETTTVRVVRMPLCWDEMKATRILSWYGEVKKCEKELWRDGYDGASYDNYAGLWNGNWRVKMIVEKPIPSSLWVSGEKFEVFYTGQTRTCFKCGKAHMINNCRTPPEGFINRFDISKFPPLEKGRFARHENNNGRNMNPEEDSEVEESAEEVMEESAEEVMEESAEEVVEKPAEEVVKEPAEEVVEEPAEEVVEEPAEEVVEEPAEEVVEELAEESSKDQGTEENIIEVQKSNKEGEIMNDSEEETMKDITDFVDTYETPAPSVNASVEEEENMVTKEDSNKTPDENSIQRADVEEETDQTPIEVEISREADNQIVHKIVEVHHAENSQLMDTAEDTATASEVEDFITPGQKMDGSMADLSLTASALTPGQKIGGSLQDLSSQAIYMEDGEETGYWTVVSSKRKIKHSSDEENGGNTIRLGFGSFENSFLSSSHRRSRQRTDGTSQENDPGEISYV